MIQCRSLRSKDYLSLCERSDGITSHKVRHDKGHSDRFILPSLPLHPFPGQPDMPSTV